jgi:hypothetical protein
MDKGMGKQGIQPTVDKPNSEIPPVVSRLDMYHTNVLMYRTMVLLARPTKVRR